jgi:hypothetical protein
VLRRDYWYSWSGAWEAARASHSPQARRRRACGCRSAPTGCRTCGSPSEQHKHVRTSDDWGRERSSGRSRGSEGEATCVRWERRRRRWGRRCGRARRLTSRSTPRSSPTPPRPRPPGATRPFLSCAAGAGILDRVGQVGCLQDVHASDDLQWAAQRLTREPWRPMPIRSSSWASVRTETTPRALLRTQKSSAAAGGVDLGVGSVVSTQLDYHRSLVITATAAYWTAEGRGRHPDIGKYKYLP